MSFRNHIPAVILVVGVALMNGCQSTQVKSAGPPPPVPVSVALATQESFSTDIRAVGTVEASAVIQVRSQVSGELVRVAFAEGAIVNQGDLLFMIDPRPFQQALRQARASLQKDTAVLSQVQANLSRDMAQSTSLEADAARFAQLAKEGVVSKSQNDQAASAAQSNQATIRADQAAIESAQASLESDRTAIETAELNLSFCEIHSPVNGRVGNLLVHQGNLIQAGATALVTINRLAPIWVSFGIPEERLSEIRQSSASQSAAGHDLAVSVTLQNDPKQTATGTLAVIDNTVDTTTGTIRLKATFTNTNGVLWPGQFVDVSLTLGTAHSVVVVPGEAVQPGQKGQVVYVVKQNQTVELRPVTVGATRGNRMVIEKGLAAGESVVVDGQSRLFPGATVRTVPAGTVDSQTL